MYTYYITVTIMIDRETAKKIYLSILTVNFRDV